MPSSPHAISVLPLSTKRYAIDQASVCPVAAGLHQLLLQSSPCCPGQHASAIFLSENSAFRNILTHFAPWHGGVHHDSALFDEFCPPIDPAVAPQDAVPLQLQSRRDDLPRLRPHSPWFPLTVPLLTCDHTSNMFRSSIHSTLTVAPCHLCSSP